MTRWGNMRQGDPGERASEEVPGTPVCVSIALLFHTNPQKSPGATSVVLGKAEGNRGGPWASFHHVIHFNLDVTLRKISVGTRIGGQNAISSLVSTKSTDGRERILWRKRHRGAGNDAPLHNVDMKGANFPMTLAREVSPHPYFTQKERGLWQG